MQALLEGVGPEGAVYVSMGTLCNFGQAEFTAIAAALSELPYRVIWKLAPGDLPGNASIASLGLAPNVKAKATCVPGCASLSPSESCWGLPP
jgi:glucuronosyltransferase